MNPTISSLMASAEGGDPSAADVLFTALYRELHDLARRQLSRSTAEMTLGTTTLLHEAYLGIAAREGTVFPDRGRFMGYAAKVMRGLIIDHVRNRKALKRGGQFHISSLDVDVAEAERADDLSRIGAALDQLAAVDADLAQIVDLKFFCGFTFAEIAALRGLNERTVRRYWDKARIYLHGAVQDEI